MTTTTKMRRLMVGGLAVALVTTGIAVSGVQNASPFSSHVDSAGNISVPTDYRQWAFLGSWHVVAKGAGDGAGVAGFHTVYTQPSSVTHYLNTGEFPDGAVLVKELLKVDTDELTTGDASWPTQIEGWFVMVKDTKGRFPGSPLWGNGWGWALFNADNANQTVTRNWRTECLGCHVPAKSTDWVYTQGYPVLQRTAR
jgi:hypothetical protein